MKINDNVAEMLRNYPVNVQAAVLEALKVNGTLPQEIGQALSAKLTEIYRAPEHVFHHQV